MEFLQDLFLTAFIAIVFSFLIAKLFSVATFGGSAAKSESILGSGVDEKVIGRELLHGERLEVKPFESERKAEFVGEIVCEADEFRTAPDQVEEIADSAEQARQIDDIGDELRRPAEKLELQKKFEDVIEEESVEAGKGFGLAQQSACGTEESKDERAQVDVIADSVTLGGEMEAGHCLRAEKLEFEVRFGDIGEDKLDRKDVGGMLPGKSEPEIKSDHIVEENVENKEQVEEMVPDKSETEMKSDDIVKENVENKEEVELMVPEKSESEVNSDHNVEEKLENKEEVGGMVLEKSEFEMSSDYVVEEKLKTKEGGEMLPEISESEVKLDHNLEDKLKKKEVGGIDEALETKNDHEVQSNELIVVGIKLERQSGE